jgi:hypothetical protein
MGVRDVDSESMLDPERMKFTCFDREDAASRSGVTSSGIDRAVGPDLHLLTTRSPYYENDYCVGTE